MDLAPRLTASAIHPPGTIAASRLHSGAEPWLPLEPRTLEMMAAAVAAYAGEMPVLCAQACATPAVEALLRRAGHARLAPRLTYRDVDDMRAQLRALAGRGCRVMAHHIPRADWLDDATSVVPRALLIELNDKANLARFVPEAALLPRQVFPARALRDAVPAGLSPPLVLKHCTELPTGSGFGVRICPDAGALERAWLEFRSRAHELYAVVAERWVSFERSWCANVAIGERDIAYLGAAEQICSAEGRWLGNFCGQGCEAPSEVRSMAMAIARAGHGRGYLGFAGFDIGVSAGRLFAIDVNFRPCGSLAQLLFHDSICARSNARVTRNWRAETPRPIGEIESRLGTMLDSGVLAPMQAYDGAAAGEPTSAIGGYVSGRDRRQIEATVDSLNRLMH